MIVRRRLWVFGLLLVSLLGCSSKQGRDGKQFTIAVIPQGSTHEYWESIHAGAVKASQDLKQQGITVNLIWKGPMREDDREQRDQVVEGFLAKALQGSVLAPFDKDALLRPVEEGGRAGIPTVLIDSP